MAISFPISPTTNQTYTVGTKTWVYNGYAWDLVTANLTPTLIIANGAFDKANAANVLAYSNSISLSTNVNTLAANVGSFYTTFVAANANAISLSTNVNILAKDFTAANSSLTSLTSNVGTLVNTFYLANANGVSLSTNVNILASNVGNLVNTFYTANANGVSLSTNVNILAATFTNANASLTTLTSNVGTLVNTFYLANANSISLAANVAQSIAASSNANNLVTIRVDGLSSFSNTNTALVQSNLTSLVNTFYSANANSISLAANVGQVIANVNTLAGAAYPKVGGTINGDVAITGNLTISGNTTYVNTQTLLIGDNTLVLNADIPGNVIATENAGLVVNRGNKSGNAQFLWIESANAWGFTGNSNAAITTYVVSNTSFESANAAVNARVDGLSSFSNTNTALVQSNLTTLVNTFYSANANSVSLAANVSTFIGFFTTANANSISLSSNVNILAKDFSAANASLTTLTSNVGTLVNTFYLANANGVSLSTNVNTLASNVGNLVNTFYTANANGVSLSTNVNILASNVGNLVNTFVAANANATSLSTNVNILAATFTNSNSSLTTLTSNVGTLVNTFYLANANAISLSTNVNQLATNVGTFFTTFTAANANATSLSTNVNILAATFVSANANLTTLSGNVSTLVNTFYSANANSISLAAYATGRLANTSGTFFAGDLLFPIGSNVALGTPTPTYSAGYSTLSVNGSTGGQIAFQVSGVGKHYIYGTSTDLNIYNSVSGNTKFYTAGISRMHIDASGNVGINTSTPTYPLHVNGALYTPNTLSNIVHMRRITSASTGINWYAPTYTAWQDYMAPSGAGQGWTGTVTAPSGTYVTSWARRSFVENGAGYGWTWEAGSGNSTTPTIIAELSSTSGNFKISGSLYAVTKSFVIDHPTKPDMKLRYGSLEGPENGVYVRGKLDGSRVIELPDYWEGLVDLDTITVQLTAIGRSQNLYVADIDGLKIHIDTENHTQPYCFYHVYAERKDVEKLVVEFESERL